MYRSARPVARILISLLALIGVIGTFIADFRVQEIRELWTASHPDAGAGDRPPRASPVVLAWWLAFLGFAFLLGGSVAHWSSDGSPAVLRIVRDEWLVATGLWAVVAAGLAAAVVVLIDLRQEERAQGHVAERWSEWRLHSPS